MEIAILAVLLVLVEAQINVLLAVALWRLAQELALVVLLASIS